MKRLNATLASFTVILIALFIIGWGFEIEMETDTIRASAILTTGFVASSSQLIDRASQLQLLAVFTKGSSSGCQIKIEFSADGSTWVQENSTTLSSGVLTHAVYVHQLTAAGSYIISVPIMATWYRISSKALVDGTNTLLAITDITGSIGN